MDYLAHHRRDYAKLWIHPFYALERKNPPMWYNRLLLQAMIDVYLNWHKKMSKTNEPFYLKIWLFDPHFIESQIVVAYRDCLHLYDNTFDSAAVQKPFPFHQYTFLKDQLELFDWKLHIDSDTYMESDLMEDLHEGLMTEKEVEKIKKQAYQVTTIPWDGKPEKVYSLQVGDVWVGTLKDEYKNIRNE